MAMTIDDDRGRPIPNEPTEPAPPHATSGAVVRPIRQQPQRTSPHDLGAEESLLSALMYSAEAIETAVGIVSTPDFYIAANQHVFSACVALYAEGDPVDPVTVASRLERDGLLEQVGGRDRLFELQAMYASASNAGAYAKAVAETARLRRVETLGVELVNAARERSQEQISQVTEGLGEILADTTTQTAWAEEDIAGLLDGSLEPPSPTLMARTDGRMLLYPGRVNSFIGASESGKSWAAFDACAQCIREGLHVLYVDWEDDAAGAVWRLGVLGVDPKMTREFFHYVRADDPVDGTANAALVSLARRYEVALVILDGVTEAMVAAGWSMMENDDVARFYGLIPRPLARTGASVVLIDHIPKSADAGPGGIGAQHKRAGIDGVAYRFDRLSEFAPGKTGAARMTIDKDRPGMVRSNSAGAKTAAVMVLKPVHGGGSEASFVPAQDYRAPEDGPEAEGDAMPKVSGVDQSILYVLKMTPGEFKSKNEIQGMIRTFNKLNGRNVLPGSDADIKSMVDLMAGPEGPLVKRKVGQWYRYAFLGEAPTPQELTTADEAPVDGPEPEREEEADLEPEPWPGQVDPFDRAREPW